MRQRNRANSLLAFVILVQIGCILFQFDHWPATNYPMFPGVMKRDDVLVFQVRAVLPDGTEMTLPHTGWPSMPNYSDSFVAGNWEGLRIQAISDYQNAKRKGYVPEEKPATELKLLRLGGDVADKILKPKDPFYFQIDLKNNEITQIFN